MVTAAELIGSEPASEVSDHGFDSRRRLRFQRVVRQRRPSRVVSAESWRLGHRKSVRWAVPFVASESDRVAISDQSSGDQPGWWDECLLCEWVGTANPSRRAAEQKLGRHYVRDRPPDSN